VTGEASGLVIVDVDPRNGGDEGIEDLQARYGQLPETPTVLTGGGGTHTYLAHPRDRAIPNRRNLGGFPGVDIKADGGYVVAPPSRHASGRVYAWNVLLHPDDVLLAPCPESLFSLFSQGPQSDRIAYEPAPWDGTVPLRALAAMESPSSRLRQRFERKADGLHDTSPSGIDASVATLAALAGCTPREVEATVRASRKGAGLPQRGASYYRATVGKALAIAAERGASTERFEHLFFEGLDRA